MLSLDQLNAIRSHDACAIVDAIETFGVRLRNGGFTRPGLQCFTCTHPRVLGYADTFRVRSSDPPATGGRFLEQTDWWPEPGSESRPRVAVLQELEPNSLGVYVGEIHAALFKTLGYQGVITNGAVRDVPLVRQMGFPVFAEVSGASRAYIHVVAHKQPVEVFGLKINAGDLLYADCHGVVNIPLHIADQIADVAAAIRTNQSSIVQACLTKHLSRAELLELIQSGLNS